jgi:hypothetical protein
MFKINRIQIKAVYTMEIVIKKKKIFLLETFFLKSN